MDDLTAASSPDEAELDAANDRLCGLAGQLNVVHARVTVEVAELLETDGWQQGAVRSPSAFLQWKLGLSPARADEVVKVARRRAEFPVLMAGFDRGEYSLEQAAAAVEAPAWADELICDFVAIATVSKIRRAMRSNMFEGDPDEPDPEPKSPQDRVSFGIGGDGRWRLSANLGVDDGRRVEAALNERKDAIFTHGNETVTWDEAFTDCFERSLDTVQSESPSRADRYRTWIHLDVTHGDATLTDGWQIPIAVADRILCDGIVQPVWETDGIPFSIGRAQHIVPDRTRRIIEQRDRGCRVPGCESRHVEIHHIIHWRNGGVTDTWNLISLCKKHHKLHHRGRLGITGNADLFDGVTFTDARGDRIGGVGQPATPSDIPQPDIPYRAPLNARFDWNWIGLGWTHPNLRTQRLQQLHEHHQRLGQHAA